MIVSFADFLMCLCSPSWKIVLNAYAQGVADMTLGQGGYSDDNDVAAVVAEVLRRQ